MQRSLSSFKASCSFPCQQDYRALRLVSLLIREDDKTLFLLRNLIWKRAWRCLFYLIPFCGEAMHMRNMGMSFFVVCPLRNCECKAPKIGMNCNQSLTILFPFDSSRLSGQISRIYTGIPKKDISMFHAKKDISMLRKRFLSPITLKRSDGVNC